MGSNEDITMEIRRMSFDERVPKKESFISRSRRVKRLTVIIVDITPRNTIVPIF